METMTSREIEHIRLAIDSQIKSIREDEENYGFTTPARTQRMAELLAIAEKLGPYRGGLRSRR